MTEKTPFVDICKKEQCLSQRKAAKGSNVNLNMASKCFSLACAKTTDIFNSLQK